MTKPSSPQIVLSMLVFASCAMGAAALAVSIMAWVRLSDLEPRDFTASGVDIASGEEADGEALQKELAVLKRRAELAGHADRAIANGDRTALNALQKIYADADSNSTFKDAANAEITRVQMFYLQSSNLLPLKIPFKIEGKVYNVDEQLSTDSLADVLLKEENAWQYRSRAAMLLGTRPSVPGVEALLKSITSDGNLSVVYQATNSFKRLTGCPSAAVFGNQEFDGWYQKNKEEVAKRLELVVEQVKAARGEGANSEDGKKGGAPANEVGEAANPEPERTPKGTGGR